MKLKFLGLSAVLLLAIGTLCAQSSSVPGQEYPSQSPSTQSPSAQPSTPPAQTPDTQAPPPSQAPEQTAPSQSAPSDQSGTASTTDSTAGTQTFTGTVVKQGDKFVLQDSATGKSYDIDHQDQVKQFEGKRVRVHGTLDASSNMIHIQ
jgi:cytoskeletal protein RodZ